MASSKLAFLAIAVLLLQASWCVVAQQASPPASASTSALMALTSFQLGGSGGGPAACDGLYHSDDGLIVALSTQWFDHRSRCNKHIHITSSQSGQTVVAQVLDECDTKSGCGANVIAASKGVWAALKLNTDIGEAPITWTDDGN